MESKLRNEHGTSVRAQKERERIRSRPRSCSSAALPSVSMHDGERPSSQSLGRLHHAHLGVSLIAFHRLNPLPALGVPSFQLYPTAAMNAIETSSLGQIPI